MTELRPRIRSAIRALPAYKAGKRPTPRAGLTTFKSSSNENPYAPLPSVVAAIAEAATRINRYPDPLATEMTYALATQFGVSADCVSTGTGSVGILGQLVQSTVDAGDEVMYAWRSFEAYPIVTAIAGGVSVRVPLRDERHDLEAMVDAITERTRLIFVCTPNNPTGTIVTTAEFDSFMQRVPADVLVVVDEAYTQFVTDPAALNGLDAFHRYQNVAVLQSFAKAYGLAGVRVGACIAQPDVTEALRKTAVPFGVSELAQVAVMASLNEQATLQQRVRAIIDQRELLVRSVRESGFSIADQQANFVWLRLGQNAGRFAAACEEAGVVVRPFLEGDDQGAGVRITVGEAVADARVLEVLRSL